GVHRESAAALARERLFDVALRGRGRVGARERSEQQRQHERRAQELRPAHAHPARTARSGTGTSTRRSAAVGHTAINVPNAITTPPSQIHTTSGFTYARIVASFVCGSYEPSTRYRSSRSVERFATSVVGCFGFL